LVVIAVAGGTVYYYQFLTPHLSSCGTPSNRLVFMTAEIQEVGGYKVTNTAFLNQTGLPGFNTAYGANLTGVSLHDYKPSSTDNKTINLNVGDTVTFYIKAINANDSRQVSTSHGFQISGPAPINVVGGSLPSGGATIPFGTWFTVTVRFDTAGEYLYFCTVFCSPEHGAMNGNISVSCGTSV
jgi:heme/copper-type cytochrome/quinol oxidase subunit 2